MSVDIVVAVKVAVKVAVEVMTEEPPPVGNPIFLSPPAFGSVGVVGFTFGACFVPHA